MVLAAGTLTNEVEVMRGKKDLKIIVLGIYTNCSSVENAVDVFLAPGALCLPGAILSRPSGANLGRRLPPAPCAGVWE